MDKPYKPLFNRSYLKALVWGVAIAVVLLSTMSPKQPDYPTVNLDAERQLFWIPAKDTEPNDLRILLRSDATLSSTSQLMQQVATLAIEQRLSDEAVAELLPSRTTVQVRSAMDRISIRLSWPTGQAKVPDLPAILDLLTEELAQAAAMEKLEQFRARQYLEQQKPEQQLVQALLDNLLNHPDRTLPSEQQLQQFYQRLFQRPPTLVLSSPEALSLVPSLAALPRQTTTGKETLLLNDAPLLQQLQGRDDSAYLLLGGTTVARQSERFIAHMVANHILQHQLQQAKVSFRLLWRPLDQIGYQALILKQPTPFSREQIEQLHQQVTKTDQATLDQIRQKLLEQYENRMFDSANHVEMLTNIAFYQLPLDTMATFRDRISALSLPEVNGLMAQQLDPGSQIVISLKP